jgi:hypothetical protein
LTDRATGIQYDVDRTPGNFVKLTAYTQQFGERKYDPYPVNRNPHITPPGGKLVIDSGVMAFEPIANDKTSSEPINNPTIFRDDIYELKFDDVLHWEKVDI